MDNVDLPFFVREQIRSCVLKRIEAFEKGYRQNVGLIGPKGRGKTSALRSIFLLLCAKPDVLPVYVDARTMDYDHFVERWIGSLLTGFFLTQSIKPPATFQSLLTTAEPLLPKTVEKIRQLKNAIRKGKIASSVRELFSLTGILSGETGKKIVLMIDEFDRMETLPVPDPFALFGKEIMVEKDTLFIVTSSSPMRVQEIFREKLSLLFGNFEVVDLKPLGFHETVEYLRQYFPKRAFTVAQKKFLIRMTDGNPVYLDLFMDRLQYCLNEDRDVHYLERAGEPAEIPAVKIIESFCEELCGGRARIDLLFKKRLNECKRFGKDHASYIKALLAVSCGRRKFLGISTFIGKKTRETKKILQRLVQEDMLIKKGSFYVLDDPLFRFWMREIFQRANQLYLPDDAWLREGVRSAIQKEYERMLEEDAMDITSRVQALFKEFRNDIVELEAKKFCLPQFSEIAFRPTNGRVFPLLAKNHKVRWLCQIAERPVCEEDVLVFIDELKHFRKNLQRRIMVTLDGIDQNAKLIAQQAQIQLWDLRSFNGLLDLYDLPKMILLDEEEKHESNMGAVAESVHST
jgi:hypothetical protein